jgi:dCTP deaminase
VLLSDRDILNALAQGDIIISPWRPEMLQPASVDVCLDNRFMGFVRGPYVLDPAEDNSRRMDSYTAPAGVPVILRPGELILGSTVEWIGLHETIAARVEGKSSLGRLGLLLHATAGFVDPGFKGSVTLELSNAGRQSIRLWPGMKIGQLCFEQMSSPVKIPYGSRTGAHYQQQDGPTASRSHIGWRVWPVREPRRDGVGGGADVPGEVSPAAAVLTEAGEQPVGRPSADVGRRFPH